MRSMFDAMGALGNGGFGGGGDDHDDDDSLRKRYRTIFISDIHLGTPGCQAAALLDFLKPTPATTSTWWATSWTAGSCAAAGTGRSRTTTWCKSCCAAPARAAASSMCPATTMSLRVNLSATSSAASRCIDEAVHTTADGRQLWIIHGDYFDAVVQCAKWLAYVGDNLYEFTLKLNRHLNRLRATAWACRTGRCRPT
jgi:hypothetical protein